MGKEKTMGLGSAISIGIGGMIGAGIFSVLGIAAEIAGNAMWISFLIAGTIAMFSAYSYSKLGARYPSAGGPVEYLVNGFGDGVLAGGFNLLLWVGYIFAIALYAKAFGEYGMTLFPAGTPAIWLNILISLVIVSFMMINFIGSKAVGRSELFIVLVKVAILILFVVVGLLFIDSSAFSSTAFPHSSNIFYAAGVVFMGYEGFGLITNTAADMEDPAKTLPKALFLSVIIVIIIYVLVSVTVLGNMPIEDILASKDYALAAAAKPFLGDLGFTFIAIAALFSTASAINATLYGGANVSYTIAKHRGLPRAFERKIWHDAGEGLLITSAIVLVSANLLPLENIAMLGSASFLLIYMAVSIAHLNLYKETNANPWLILMSIVSCLVFFIILMFYLWKSSPITLAIMTLLIFSVFTSEWAYRRTYQKTT